MTGRPVVTSDGRVPCPQPGGYPDGPVGPTSARRRAPGLRWIVVVSLLVLATASAGGDVWATNADVGSGGPEQFASAMLSPSPTPDTVSNGGCSTAATQQTNVTAGWTDSQSTAQDASGGSLITGYTESRSARRAART